MATNDTGYNALFIVDDEYTGTAPQLLDKANRVQEIWDEYISISSQIVGAQGSLAGSRAKAYSEFIEIAKKHFSQKLKDVSVEIEKDMKTYVDMIDEVDDVLY